MKKIIVKMRLRSREDFENRLTAMGMDFGPIYWQHDRVYVPRNYQRGGNYPRMAMRTEMKAVDRPPKYSLILKRHIEDSGVEVVHETVVKDYTEAANVILQLGFRQAAEVSRRRQEIKMEQGTMMYLDKIEGVQGYFAKIEVELDEKESAEAQRKEVLKTFESLDQSNEVPQSYAEIINA